jgi:hypothetical protein
MPGLGEDRRLLVSLAPHLRDMRMARYRMEIGINSKRPDRAGEALEIGEFQRLTGKGQHQVPQPVRPQRGHFFASEMAAKIDATHHCAAGRILRLDFDRHVSSPNLCLALPSL